MLFGDFGLIIATWDWCGYIGGLLHYSNLEHGSYFDKGLKQGDG